MNVIFDPFARIFGESAPAADCRRTGNCPHIPLIHAKAAELRQLQGTLQQKKNALNRQEKKLKEYSAALDAREAALDTREAALIAREAELNRRQAALEQESARRAPELRHTEAVRRDKPAATVEDELNRVRKSFVDLNSEMQQTRLQLVHLMETVSRNSRDGVYKMCHLYRDMMLSQNERLRPFADRLALILQTEFSAEPLDPCPGETYNSTCQERLDASRMGSRILCCKARGWRWKGEILMRAVVDTEERNERE